MCIMAAAGKHPQPSHELNTSTSSSHVQNKVWLVMTKKKQLLHTSVIALGLKPTVTTKQSVWKRLISNAEVDEHRGAL